MSIDEVAAAARACRLCASELPLGPRPVLRVSATARLLIVGQAPGTKVHASGIPWNDPSGVRLRDWLRMDEAVFYDESRVAIVPMGLCYPGVLPKGGDRPPMPICAATWHPRLLPLMPEIRLTLVVGTYAMARLLGKGPMAAKVKALADHLPRYFPLPHPSWRTLGWQLRNPWFEAEVLPDLRARVATALSG
jgi:uracil-DNA glycosylase